MTTPDLGRIADALAVALNKRGRRCAVFRSDIPNVPNGGGIRYGVNVWRDRDDRFPADTVWVDSGGFTWGDRFQNSASLAHNVPTIATRVDATTPKVDE